MASDIKRVNGFWFPADDTECSAVVFDELHKLEKLPLERFDTVVQAGGNVGVFPDALAKMFKHVYTYEPDARNFDCLVRNTGHVENIYRFFAGLSNMTGTGSVAGDRANCGALQIAPGSDVPLHTIDDLNLEACDLIYLDIEGYEDRALTGALHTIHKHNPVIVVENKGLMPGWSKGIDGCPKFREWVCMTFGYEYHGRLMRDDVFVSRRAPVPVDEDGCDPSGAWRE